MSEQTLWEAPEIQIGEETYRFRRLGLKDLKDVFNIVRGALQAGLDRETLAQLQDDETDNIQGGMNLIFEAIPYATDEVARWLVDTVEDFEVEDIEDPSELPLPVLMDIITILGEEHEDFKKFFTKAGKAWEILQTMGQNLNLSLGSLIQSNPSMDGQTSESSE